MANTIILGGGIIGLSTAYYLAQHQPGSTIHIVDPSPELFASASGKAAGFIARDWFGPDTADLGALSFAEHQRLAEAHDGAARWGYAPSTALNYGERAPGGGSGSDWLRAGTSRAEAASAAAAAPGTAKVPGWLKSADASVVGDEGGAAQVDPLRLCRFLLDECVKQGVKLHHPARAAAVLKDIREELSGVRIEETESSTETDVPCTRLIIAAGSWSPRVFEDLFPKATSKPPISSLAGHSLVVRSPRWTERTEKEGGLACHAVFLTKPGFAPEMFSRAGAEIWIGGLNSSTIPLPEKATESVVQAERIAELKKVAVELLGAPDGAGPDGLEVVREALCFRPVTAAGTPIVARVEDGRLGGTMATRAGAEGGVFLAAGHGPWGISQSLGTGVVLAELAQGRPLSADISSLAVW